jgi:hypothetical protein
MLVLKQLPLLNALRMTDCSWPGHALILSRLRLNDAVVEVTNQMGRLSMVRLSNLVSSVVMRMHDAQ